MAVFCNEIDFRFSQGIAAAAIKATTVNALSMIRTLFLSAAQRKSIPPRAAKPASGNSIDRSTTVE